MASSHNLPEPWKIDGAPWDTEPKFLAWVRGVLRKGWSRHPIKIMFIHAIRKRIPNTNPRSMKRFPETWACDCAQCGGTFPQKDIEIDHINAAGSLTLDTLGDFAARLYCVDFSSLRAVCKPCHKTISYAERMGLPFKEAAAAKAAIAFMKEDKQVILDFLASYGYNGVSVSSAEKRKKLVETIMKEKANGTD